MSDNVLAGWSVLTDRQLVHYPIHHNYTKSPVPTLLFQYCVTLFLSSFCTFPWFVCVDFFH